MVYEISVASFEKELEQFVDGRIVVVMRGDEETNSICESVLRRRGFNWVYEKKGDKENYINPYFVNLPEIHFVS